MVKMVTRSSPVKDPENDSPLRSPGLRKNPSMELCHFTNPEIYQLRHCFPDGTILRPFDSLVKMIASLMPGSPFLFPHSRLASITLFRRSQRASSP
ncbi:hypothetical protein Hanom_Chr08g00701591 [Helianthus anomalus]